MEKLISGLLSFYIANDNFPYVINFDTTLTEPIDKTALQKAVGLAQQRYSYLSVRTVVSNEQYMLESNDRPFVIFNHAEDAVLGSSEANYHLVAFAAHENTINFLVFHGLADGNGIFPFIKTVLYLYLSETTGQKLDDGNVRLPDEPALAPEFVDPWPAYIPESIQPFGAYVPNDVFHLPEYVDDAGIAPVVYEITLPEDAFMKYTRESDGSPATMVSAFLFKTIQSVHPENTKTISCGMAFNQRRVLHVPDTYHNCASQLHLGYQPDMGSLPLTKLATVSRGMVFLQSEPENTLVAIRSQMATRKQLLTISHEQRKAAIAQRVQTSMSADTFNVSYVGKWQFGELESYITTMHPFTSISGMALVVEITAIHGHFVLTFMQGFEESLYVDRFCELLAEEGVDCEKSGPFPLKLPGLMLEPK